MTARKVLIVDDEIDVRESLGMLLELERFSPMTAPHGAAALEMLGQNVPDIIISDFMMPWMNGREFVTKVKAREDTRHIPVILVSAVDPGPPEPWDAFLKKPAQIQTLLDTMRRLLGHR